MNTEIIKSRVEKLRALMSEKNLDAFVLLVEERANSESCHYISGFRGSSAALIISMDEEILITDGRYKTQSKNQSPFEIIIQSEFSLPEYIAKAVKDSDFKRIGFEAEKISHAEFEKYFAPVKVEWIDASELILKLRRTKDFYEISRIKEAAKIAREAYGNVLKKVHEGMSEIEFEIKLMEEIKLLGAEKGWAHDDFIVASGTRSAMCHAPATLKKFELGETVTVDYGAMVEGYMCDITRNFAIGRADKKALEINEVLLKAHREAVKILRPGISGREVDAEARRVISDAGYGKNFLHGLGHGLGLEVHEAPRLSRSSEDILQAGDVVTIEPGIYIEGWGGLRIEDDYLITEDGAECLTLNDNQSLEII
ncbi:MAG: Xaa-Pro peptidase family protein [Synergistales bacterium]|nr:Xaa-Pro peptidase family protein [Synergistales bacterium]MDY6405283.1 Xaa-Pro peptidase family protein [Synergistales bacterium]MDY6410973.1 Xaa-Pro peptidase family protein [Synergistales bacterium]MDY6414138.1 Xaa-Pro peptidase family protein [Synergistales bacterium]MDY6429487.1 Xaa-Pro peptidase family protein [Synergistales bacterium]